MRNWHAIGRGVFFSGAAEIGHINETYFMGNLKIVPDADMLNLRSDSRYQS
jgi:hypothetical protein